MLASRSEKLQKRIEKARGQLEDAERHLQGYAAEAKHRAADQLEAKAPAAPPEGRPE